MKKTLLALATTLLLPNMSYAAACADGANAAGCTIGTTGFDYTLTGDIAPASGVVGIQFTSGATTNTTTLTGDISTTGIRAYGLYLNTSNSNTTTLTGDITTAGDNAYGLWLSGSNSNTTTLTGDISTTGDNTYGVYLYNSYSNTTTINGDISVAEGYGVTIQESDFNNTAITGDITAGGDFSMGALLTDSHSNTLTLGNISVDATLSGAGVWLEASDSNEIIINGRVSGSGEADAIRVQNTSDSNTITLNQGGSIIGNIVNDSTNNTLNFNLGRAASYNFTTSGSVDWILNDSTKTVIAGSAKSRGVADMDDAGNRLYQRLSQINSSLTNQQRQTRQGYARGDYWIDSYYTDSERDTSPAQINQHTRGITVGFNASGDRDLAMDVIINYENSDAGYGLSEQTVDSNSLMVGLSFPALMTAMDGSLAVKFLAGMSDNDRDLTVLNNTVTSGQETITDSYDSTYVTAGASWMQSLYATPRFSSQFLLGMDINHEQIEGSTASAYYRLDDRDITQLVGQAQYGITIQGMNKQLQINGSIGLAHANIIDGEKQHYTIDGTAVSYTADNSNTYTTASLGATYQLNPQAYAYANVKQFDSTDDIDGTTGKVGLVVSF